MWGQGQGLVCIPGKEQAATDTLKWLLWKEKPSQIIWETEFHCSMELCASCTESYEMRLFHLPTFLSHKEICVFDIRKNSLRQKICWWGEATLFSILMAQEERIRDLKDFFFFLCWKRLNSHILSQELEDLLRTSQLFPTNALGDFARKRQLLQE